MRRIALASNSTPHLEEARAALHDKNTVCFLGEAKSGKTVSSALLKHALFNHFIPGCEHGYQAIVSKGMDSINRSLGDMIMDRQFPAATRPFSGSRVVIDIYKMSGGNGGKSEIILQDSSGEDFFNYLVRECSDPNDRLSMILRHSSGPNGAGSLAHYIFAKLYILAIDCSSVDTLDHKQSLLANAITALHKVHTDAHLTDNGKISRPIAILFTKADLLNGDGSSDAPAKLFERMPELKSALDRCHKGSLDFFKVSLSTSIESDDDRAERIRRERLRYDTECAKAAERRRSNEDKITAMCTREREKTAGELGEAELEAHMSEYSEKLHNELNLKTPLPEDFDEEKIRNAQTRRPESPLAYTHDEYVRLIMWVISQMVDST